MLGCGGSSESNETATWEKIGNNLTCKLNLQENGQGLTVCRGRLQGHGLSSEHSPFHREISTRGTLAYPSRGSWTNYHAYSKEIFGTQAKTFSETTNQILLRLSQIPGNSCRQTAAFQIVGVDYAGTLKYRKKSGKEGKAYIVLYTCSLTRVLYLELTATMETREFLPSLKRLIARRGRPEKIYSDNGRTFVGAARWIRTVMEDERIQDFLAGQEIKWQFNLSRAPWWDGQFERIVGLVKNCLYKSIGKGC